MAALVRKATNLGVIKAQWATTYQVVRNHWNYEWKPSPYPLTKEEREAAAKKYGVAPEEYKTYPDDGLGLGDYPKLPDVSGETKDPYYPWDFPELKRNFNEPMHVQADMYGEDRYNVNLNPKYPLWLQAAMFLGVTLGGMAVYYAIDDYRMIRPVLPKQYPMPGVPHYTFEPSE